GAASLRSRLSTWPLGVPVLPSGPTSQQGLEFRISIGTKIQQYPANWSLGSSRSRRPLRFLPRQRPRHDRLRRSLENLVLGNRVAEDGIHQHAAAVAREEYQHLLLDLADLDDVFPAHPSAASPEVFEHPVLVHQAVV